MLTFPSDTRLQLLSELQDSFPDEFLWQVVPDSPQHFSQFGGVLRLRQKSQVPMQHCAPDMKVQPVQIWEVRRPLEIFPKLAG